MTIAAFAVYLAFLNPRYSFANTWSAILNKKHVQIDLPKTWKEVSGIFGLELAFIGPWAPTAGSGQGSRPSVAITDLELDHYAFDAASLEKKSQEYREGRELWLEKKKGKAIAFFPQKKIEWGTLQGYQMGMKYRLGTAEIVEHSYIMQCGKRMYHAKTLMRLNLEARHGEEALKIVKSLKCRPSEGKAR